MDPTSDQALKALDRYQKALLRNFHDSPEAADLRKAGSGISYWAEQMIHLGFSYLGATPPSLTASQAEEILTELFPRKISLSSPDEADTAIPELLAFWSYLEREYRLPNAPAILSLLREVQPEFKRMMNDPSKFGLAKSFVMAGQAAGFDMSDEKQLQQFTYLYNASLAAEHEARSAGHPGGRRTASSRKLRNRVRKLSRQARKRNRKKG
jgi:hypothetical protein